MQNDCAGADKEKRDLIVREENGTRIVAADAAENERYYPDLARSNPRLAQVQDRVRDECHSLILACVSCNSSFIRLQR